MASYNGWSNYETWAVKLWMDKDAGSYESIRDTVRDASEFCPEGEERTWLADYLKDEYDEARPELEGVWADLLGAAFEAVDWYEIATSLLKEIAEETNA